MTVCLEERRISQEFFDRVDRSMYILTAFVFYILPPSYPSLTYFSSLEDHDGKITWEEFWQGAKENPDEGVVLSEEEAGKTFNEWDMNGDGVIDGKEFWNVMMLCVSRFPYNTPYAPGEALDIKTITYNCTERNGDRALK